MGWKHLFKSAKKALWRYSYHVVNASKNTFSEGFVRMYIDKMLLFAKQSKIYTFPQERKLHFFLEPENPN